jgi:hypothetical protein
MPSATPFAKSIPTIPVNLPTVSAKTITAAPVVTAAPSSSQELAGALFVAAAGPVVSEILMHAPVIL